MIFTSKSHRRKGKKAGTGLQVVRYSPHWRRAPTENTRLGVDREMHLVAQESTEAATVAVLPALAASSQAPHLKMET